MKGYRWYFGWFLSAFVVKVIAAVALTALLFMWIWNGLITGWSGLETITYLQSIGLLVLFRLLTGFPRHKTFRFHPYTCEYAMVRREDHHHDQPIS